jgi:hypothetical protein
MCYRSAEIHRDETHYVEIGMNRPFMRASILELEGLFESSQSDLKTLKSLVDELEKRSTDRATSLRGRLIAAIAELEGGLRSTPRPATQTSRQASSPKHVDAAAAASAATTPPPGAPPQSAKTAPRPERRVEDKPEEILSAWTALEVLSPSLPYKKPSDMTEGEERRIVSFEKFQTPPWFGEGEKSLPKKRLFYHVVLGAVRMEAATSALLSVYADKNADRQSASGFSPLATITLDKTGRPVEEQAVAISSFAWGLPFALKGDLRSLGGWILAEAQLVKTMDQQVRVTDREGKLVPLNFGTIRQAYDKLVKVLGLPGDLAEPPSFAIRVYQFMYAKEPPEAPLLGSFILADLEQTRNSVKVGGLPPNLAAFLGVTKPESWHDVLKMPGLIADLVAPARFPVGRWPVPGRNPLVWLQQAAVNLSISGAGGSMTSVNGPPGTGKTTLLRDIVSALVTQRAEAMCSFEDPEQAFVEAAKHKIDQADVPISRLAKSLRGYEMLVTSSNNAAVENVSRELPNISAISNDATSLRYFKSISDNVAEKQETWGTVAAVLGNASNRYNFRERFWVDADRGLRAYLAEAAGVPQAIDEPDPERPERLRIRKPIVVQKEMPPSGRADALRRWNATRSAFIAAFKEMKAELEHLEAGRKAASKLPTLAERHENAIAAVAETDAQVKFAAARVVEARSRHQAAEEQLAKAASAMVAHGENRPSLVARLLRLRPAREWNFEAGRLRDEHARHRDTHAAEAGRVASADRVHGDAKSNHATAKEGLVAAALAHDEARATISAVAARCGAKFVDDAFLGRPHHEVHLDSPWLSGELQVKRDRVFELAVGLHKAFIDAAAKPLRHNLEILFRTFYGALSRSPKIKPLMPDLWSSLFLVVPVLSTTFASIERMLGYLPPESLGWLLVDEAGQAVPQAVVGAMMRTKRAIVLGDPQQIEPVTGLPTALAESICRDFGVDPDRWNAPAASVQSVADAASNLGTVFEREIGSVRVGFPLLVHRRCAEPMFSISNRLAYSGLMVHAVGSRTSPIRDVLGASHWLDITPDQTTDKWSEREGDAVIGLLRRLADADVSAPLDLYIVSPFRIVAQRMRERLAKSGLLPRWTGDPWRWTRERIGTVHTVQGREADSVVFVLGAALPSQGGARSWAAGSVNLLNVAVTRAEENIYVVGNRSVWKEMGTFRHLAQRVPPRT